MLIASLASWRRQHVLAVWCLKQYLVQLDDGLKVVICTDKEAMDKPLNKKEVSKNEWDRLSGAMYQNMLTIWPIY